MNELSSWGSVPHPRRPLGPQSGDVIVSSVREADSGSPAREEVVLLLQADEEGAVGLRLNHPHTDVDFDRFLPAWRHEVTPPPLVFDGGPRSREGVMCLGETVDATVEPLGFERLFGTVGLVEMDTPVSLLGEYEELRLFRGYCGWAGGELEQEISDGWWHLVGGDDVDVFTTRPQLLWRQTVQNFPGQMAYYATFTSRPELN